MINLGNNTLWCFANDTGYWDEYASAGHVYIIIDFKKPVTNMYKFVVYLPSPCDFYDMYNEYIQDTGEYSKKIGIPNIYKLMWDLDTKYAPQFAETA